MARKEKAEPTPGGEDYAFSLPNFDERAFITREVSSARVTFVAVGVGLVAGVVARLVHLALDAAGSAFWQAGLLPVIAAIWAVPRVAQRFGAEVDPKDWKQVAGNAFIVFFTALAVWILLLNEPFA